MRKLYLFTSEKYLCPSYIKFFISNKLITQKSFTTRCAGRVYDHKKRIERMCYLQVIGGEYYYFSHQNRFVDEEDGM